MQGHPESARLDRMLGNPPLLGHMPYHPEAEVMITDQLEAIRQANKAAALTTSQAVDTAMFIAKNAKV